MMKILIVDDNELTLDIENMMVLSCGAETETALSGEKAVDLAKNQRFDTIFMDIQMPGTDGFTAAEKIREFDKETKIYAVSADEINYTDERFVKSGMNGCICKPLDIDTLDKLIGEEARSTEQITDNKEKEDESNLFDFDSLLELVGDKETVALLIQQFLSSHGSDCDLLWQYAEKGEYLSARSIMHTLVGVAGTMYCTPLHQACVKLGAEFRVENHQSFESFRNIWNSTITQLKKCCDNL